METSYSAHIHLNKTIIPSTSVRGSQARQIVTMRHIHFLLLILFAGFTALTVPSCQKAPELRVTGPSSVELSADGGNGTIAFITSRDWMASVSESWLSLSSSFGPASDNPVNINVSCSANKSYDDRSATITIKAEDLSQNISVKQAGKSGLLVSSTSRTVPYEENELEITVNTNVDFDVTADVDWIHYVGTKALVSSTVRLLINENTGLNTRSGKVIISQRDGSLTQTINIEQARKIPVMSITLSNNNVVLKEGESLQLSAKVNPSNASIKDVTWSSTNSTIATVDGTGKVLAVNSGVTEIKASADGRTASCTVHVAPKQSPAPEGAVDLGLGVYWATCDLGSSAPERAGLLFAWGELETKSSFSWSNYKWGNSGSILKYNSSDKIITLEAADDAAHAKLGGRWRMPTEQELRKMFSVCTWEIASFNGYSVLKGVSTITGESIILPPASSSSKEKSAKYWTSIREDNFLYAKTIRHIVDTGSEADDFTPSSRYLGIRIRPVLDK